MCPLLSPSIFPFPSYTPFTSFREMRFFFSLLNTSIMKLVLVPVVLKKVCCQCMVSVIFALFELNTNELLLLSFFFVLCRSWVLQTHFLLSCRVSGQTGKSQIVGGPRQWLHRSTDQCWSWVDLQASPQSSLEGGCVFDGIGWFVC